MKQRVNYWWSEADDWLLVAQETKRNFKKTLISTWHLMWLSRRVLIFIPLVSKAIQRCICFKVNRADKPQRKSVQPHCSRCRGRVCSCWTIRSPTHSSSCTAGAKCAQEGKLARPPWLKNTIETSPLFLSLLLEPQHLINFEPRFVFLFISLHECRENQAIQCKDAVSVCN